MISSSPGHIYTRGRFISQIFRVKVYFFPRFKQFMRCKTIRNVGVFFICFCCGTPWDRSVQSSYKAAQRMWPIILWWTRRQPKPVTIIFTKNRKKKLKFKKKKEEGEENLTITYQIQSLLVFNVTQSQLSKCYIWQT